MKLRKAMFGLRPVTRDFSGSGRWPIEEQKIMSGKDGEPSMVDDILEDFKKNKDKGVTLDDIIGGVDDLPEEKKEEKKTAVKAEIGAKWADDIEIEDEDIPEAPEGKVEEPGTIVAPTQGTDMAFIKVKNSQVSGLHCAIGEYEGALRLLQKQIALVNPKPLRPVMQQACLYGRPRFTTLPNAFSTEIQLINSSKLPVVAIQFELLNSIHKVIHQAQPLGRHGLHDRG